jgi:hypothetical protein
MSRFFHVSRRLSLRGVSCRAQVRALVERNPAHSRRRSGHVLAGVALVDQLPACSICTADGFGFHTNFRPGVTPTSLRCSCVRLSCPPLRNRLMKQVKLAIDGPSGVDSKLTLRETPDEPRRLRAALDRLTSTPRMSLCATSFHLHRRLTHLRFIRDSIRPGSSVGLTYAGGVTKSPPAFFPILSITS